MTTNTHQPPLRSRNWFAAQDVNGFLHRSWMKNQGIPDRMFDGRPVIGICNTYSELTPCNAHLRALAEHVKRGVYESGGFPVEFPVTSLGENLIRPTSMLLRNLVAMDVEESIRGNPIDGVVLLCGCDKTTPALAMGAASCDLPTIVVSGGPMLNGNFRGRQIGSGTHMFEMDDDYRAGKLTRADYLAAEASTSRSAGHCNTMGTASTMASIVEALGLALPGNAAIPAVDSRRKVLAQDTGRRIVEMVTENLTISKILTRPAFENAIRVNAAIGGSTNAVLHLLALAGRVDVELTLDDFDRHGAELPLLVDLLPSGKFLMEDFFYAGGLPAVIRALGELIDARAITVTGQTLMAANAFAENWSREVIRSLDDPVRERAGIAVLRGNLVPAGAVIKPSAATPQLLRHRGPAVVFESFEDLRARIDDPDLPIDENSVVVLKGAGPRGWPGMPELGNLPLPRKLLQAGVRDMVRISDARMSGTAGGTVVLHAAPEAAVGGPLALVKDGDLIELDAHQRRLDLLVDDGELRRRRDQSTPPEPVVSGGYARLYVDHVTQADTGVDFDFLQGRRDATVTRGNH
jgi:L-arabonate dehydrase